MRTLENFNINIVKLGVNFSVFCVHVDRTTSKTLVIGKFMFCASEYWKNEVKEGK